MNDCAGLLLNRLHTAAKTGAQTDIHKVLGNLTMDVIGTAAFGCGEDALHKFLEQLDRNQCIL